MQSEELKQKKKKYDTVCKKVLSQKPVLAKILKSCVDEYKDYDMKFIEEQCIEGDTISFSMGVNPDESYPHIIGDDTVDKLEREGTVYYDIRFNTLVPGTDEYIKLIINIEAQTIHGKKEPPLKRAVYYASRLISAQNGTEFTKADYDKIHKVYSIWICINGEEKLHNTVTEYCLCEKNVLGYYRGNKEKYDLIDIIIIGLGGFEKKDDETIIGFLDNILDRDLEPLMRRKILKEKFDITTDEDLMEVFDDMCNLSDGVYLDGVEKGIIQGEARGIEKGIMQGKAEGLLQGEARGIEKGRFELIKKFIQKGHSFESALDMFDITDKKEVEALKNAIKA